MQTKPKNHVIIPMRPAYGIERCYDCPSFVNNGAEYGDGHICGDIEYDNRVSGSDIPDKCPRLGREKTTHG